MEKLESTPALFATFVMGMMSATLVELGIVEDPVSKKKRVQTEAARQHIDLLIMLQEKTKGNLSSDEHGLLTRVLTDLRMEYVKVAASSNAKMEMKK